LGSEILTQAGSLTQGNVYTSRSGTSSISDYSYFFEWNRFFWGHVMSYMAYLAQ